ncbi:MAG TPA: malic enzyme-like NAD(P)-binding protein, partial [Candidatus Paceibacterota bacterium]|nr:malic enzyme-like NAD(P)-binding protein [Candidatus Paceibacterota bacterium]
MKIGEKSLKVHRKLRGKIVVSSKVKIRSFADLSAYYTPGVGAVSSYLARHKGEVRKFTMKGNSVAIVSDGSAVLGLGNLGPEGAIPVMEGKTMIFKEFAGIDAFPIVLDTQDSDEIVRTIEAIAPVFGGVNLEDISAPRCFEIESRLKESLDIPVMHDDQHGTAIVVLAGLVNAFKAVRKNLKKAKIAVLGAGAAGTAITKLLLHYGVRDIVVVDSRGILGPGRKKLEPYKRELARMTNKSGIDGGVGEAVLGRDAVVGVSQSGILKPEHVRTMTAYPVVFAMANPVPEIMP